MTSGEAAADNETDPKWAVPVLVLQVLLAGLSLLICTFAMPIGRMLGVLDLPDGRRKLHARATPLVGGIAVLVPVLLIAVWQAASTDFTPFYSVLAGAILAMTLLGLMDDRRHIPASLRLVIECVVVLATLYFVPGLRIEYLWLRFADTPIFLGAWGGMAFTLVCLVGLQNAVNMADGKNGLVIGMALIWTMILSAYGPSHLSPLLIVLALGLAVALAFNLRGLLFLGDAGTYGLSMLFGLLAIYTHNIGFPRLSADGIIMLFFIPVIDVLRLMVVRIAQRRSPFNSDRNHFHHILLAMLPWHWALAVYLLLAAVPPLAALYLPLATPHMLVTQLVVYVVIVGLRRWLVARPAPAPATSN